MVRRKKRNRVISDAVSGIGGMFAFALGETLQRNRPANKKLLKKIGIKVNG